MRELTNEIRNYRLKSIDEGETEANRRKNRYRDIIPCNLMKLKLGINGSSQCKIKNIYHKSMDSKKQQKKKKRILKSVNHNY